MDASEVELVDAARAARPHLELLVEEDSEAVDERLGVLIAEAEEGRSVELLLIDVITEHPQLRTFVSDFIAVPASLRSYQQPPGHHDPPTVPRYVCKQHGTSAYRFSAADPEPVCSVDGGPMERAS